MFKAQSQDFYRTAYGEVNLLFLRGNFLLVFIFLRKLIFFRIPSSEEKINVRKVRKSCVTLLGELKFNKQHRALISWSKESTDTKSAGDMGLKVSIRVPGTEVIMR